MTLRTIAFVFAYCALLLLAFAFPAAGVWGFLIESNYHPPYNLWWGRPLLALGERWSFYIGSVMVLTTLLHWPRLSHAPVFRHPETVLLGLYTLNTCLVTAWAFDFQISYQECIENIKWFLVYLCIVKTHSNRTYRPVILLIYLLAAIDAGWQCTFQPKRGRFVRGGPTTACFDENFVSAHMVALLPLAGLYAVSPAVPWYWRLICVGGAPLMMNVIAHGQSRGAFLGLSAVALALPLLAKGKLRWWSILVLLVGALLALRLFNEQFWQRMSTIQSHEQDSSVTNRFQAWRDAWSLSLKNPLGYGAEAFDRGLPKSVTVSTHNMYLECLVAWGFQGTFLWLSFLAVVMWSAYKISASFARQADSLHEREYVEAVGLLIGLIGMLVAAVFLNRMRWELWRVFPAYVVCLKNVLARQPKGWGRSFV